MGEKGVKPQQSYHHNPPTLKPSYPELYQEHETYEYKGRGSTNPYQSQVKDSSYHDHPQVPGPMVDDLKVPESSHPYRSQVKDVRYHDIQQVKSSSYPEAHKEKSQAYQHRVKGSSYQDPYKVSSYSDPSFNEIDDGEEPRPPRELDQTNPFSPQALLSPDHVIVSPKPFRDDFTDGQTIPDYMRDSRDTFFGRGPNSAYTGATSYQDTPLDSYNAYPSSQYSTPYHYPQVEPVYTTKPANVPTPSHYSTRAPDYYQDYESPHLQTRDYAPYPDDYSSYQDYSPNYIQPYSQDPFNKPFPRIDILSQYSQDKSQYSPASTAEQTLGSKPSTAPTPGGYSDPYSPAPPYPYSQYTPSHTGSVREADIYARSIHSFPDIQVHNTVNHLKEECGPS